MATRRSGCGSILQSDLFRRLMKAIADLKDQPGDGIEVRPQTLDLHMQSAGRTLSAIIVQAAIALTARVQRASFIPCWQ